MLEQRHSFETLWIDRKMDIDRLHAVLEGKYWNERGAGHTFATVVRMVHEVYQGDPGNRYLYVGETHTATDMYAFRPLYNILKQEGFALTISKVRRELHVKSTGMTFMFDHPHTNMICKYKGYMFSRLFIDLMSDTKWHYDRELAELNLRNEEYRYG